MMTKIKLIIALLIFSMTCSAQADFIKEFSKRDNMTSVVISKKMFQLVSSVPDLEINLEGMTDKIEGLYVLTTGDATNMKDLKAEMSKTVDSGYELLMTVKDDGDDINMYIKQEGELIKEFLMLIEEQSDCTLISIDGSFTMDEIVKMSQSFDE